jgi:hypothetical protein
MKSNTLFQGGFSSFVEALLSHNEDKNEVVMSTLSGRKRRKVQWQAAMLMDQLLMAGCFSSDWHAKQGAMHAETFFVWGLERGRRVYKIKQLAMVSIYVLSRMTGRRIQLFRCWFWICAQCNALRTSGNRLKYWVTDIASTPALKRVGKMKSFLMMMYGRRRAPSLNVAFQIFGEPTDEYFKSVPAYRILFQSIENFVGAVKKVNANYWFGTKPTELMKSRFLSIPIQSNLLVSKSARTGLQTSRRLNMRWLKKLAFLLNQLTMKGFVYRRWSILGLLFIHLWMTDTHVHYLLNFSANRPSSLPKAKMLHLRPAHNIPYRLFAKPFLPFFFKRPFYTIHHGHHACERVFGFK